MISLYLYPDQAISDVWTEWSDTTLNKKHPAKFTTPTGFQLVRGAINANDRTRAGEFFQLGLLRGILVNPQGAGRTEMPYGWGLVQSDVNVHSHLGYLAYALGSAMKQGSPSRVVQEAFEVLCGIFLLQTGFSSNGQNFLTSSLFLYLQDSFNASSLGDMRYQRYLAAGMFCTLSMSAERTQMMSQYLSGQPVTELWLKTDRSQTKFAAADLPDIVATRRPSLGSVRPEKHSLYWLGHPTGNRPRGVFVVAARSNRTLLKVAADIERAAFQRNEASPFAGVIEKQTAGELPCVLETLKAIFSTNAEAGNEWRRAMDTLYKGVLEALRFLKTDGGVGESPQAFFAHGVKNSASADAIILEVERSRCVTEPRVDDAVIIRERTYVIKEVRANGTSFRIKIERIRQISSTERSATRFHVL